VFGNGENGQGSADISACTSGKGGTLFVALVQASAMVCGDVRGRGDVGDGVGVYVGVPWLSATVSATALVSTSECVAASSIVGGGVGNDVGELSATMSATALVSALECLGCRLRCRQLRRYPRRSVWWHPRLSAEVSAMTI